MYCKDWSLVKHLSHGLSVRPLFCRSWKCAECAPRRAEQLKWQALDGSPTTFITLTVNTKRGGLPEWAARDLAHAWRKLRLAAMKRFKLKEFPFLAVFEKTKQGWPHLHIICRVGYIPQRWLSAMMNKYIGAPIVDIRKVKTRKGAARYVTKYVSKDTHRFQGVKRYWASRDWSLKRKPKEQPVFDANEKFQVRQLPVWAVVRSLVEDGYRAVQDARDKWCFILNHPSGGPP